MASKRLSAEEKFSNKISAYRTYKSDADYIYDCKKIQEIIEPFAGLFAAYFLFAFGVDVETKAKIPLKSLSSLDADDAMRIQFEELSSERDLDTFIQYGISEKYEGSSISIFSNSNSYCVFVQSAESIVFSEKVLREFSMVYNVTILRSHNYRNHVGAISHRYSKSQHGELNPKFNNVGELIQQVKKCFDVSAAHYVYVGNRRPSTGFQSDCLSLDGKNFRQFDRITKTRDLLGDLKSCIEQCQSRIGFFRKNSSASYFVLPIYNHNIRSSEDGRRTNGFVLFWKDSKFQYAEVRLIEDWLTSFSSKMHIQRAGIISRANEQSDFLLSYMSRGRPMGWNHVKKSFRRVSNTICEGLVKFTDAESATVRLYNPQSRRLEKIAGHQSDLGEYVETEETDEHEISISTSKTSLNAFVFQNGQIIKGYASISDVSKIPNHYKELGLRKVLKKHRHSRSEVCFQLNISNSAFGVLNVESPIPGAINDQDSIDLISQCSKQLNNHWEKTVGLRDANGLARLAQSQIKLHSIADLLRNWDGKDQPGAYQIAHRLKERHNPDEQKYFKTKIEQREVEEIIHGYNKRNVRRIKEAISLKGKDGLKVSNILRGKIPSDIRTVAVASLFLIVDSILENITKRDGLDYQFLVVDDLRKDSNPREALRLVWESGVALDATINDDFLGLEPLEKSDGALHYGIFLIGVHARQLGGIFSFERLKDDESGFRLIVELPVF